VRITYEVLVVDEGCGTLRRELSLSPKSEAFSECVSAFAVVLCLECVLRSNGWSFGSGEWDDLQQHNKQSLFGVERPAHNEHLSPLLLLLDVFSSINSSQGGTTLSMESCIVYKK
jgi:hypothetical protein